MQQNENNDRSAASDETQAGATPSARTRNSSVDDLQVPRTDPNLDLTFAEQNSSDEDRRSQNG